MPAAPGILQDVLLGVRDATEYGKYHVIEMIPHSSYITPDVIVTGLETLSNK